MKYAIEDNNWRNSHFHNGSDSLTFVQGVMRHDSLPGWYLAFSEGRTTNYNGTWDNQTYLNQNQWTQLIVGHEYVYKRLRYGWDVMGGSASVDDRWQARVKFFSDLRLTDSFSFFNYLYQQIDHRRSGGAQNDRDVRSFKIEPGVQYIINNTTGVWLRQQFASAILDREQWGDIDDKSWMTSIGVWRNWGNYQPHSAADMVIIRRKCPERGWRSLSEYAQPLPQSVSKLSPDLSFYAFRRSDRFSE